MKNCPTCQTELPENHPAFYRSIIADWVKDNGGWRIFEYQHTAKNTGFNIPNLGTVTIVDIKTDYDTGDVDRDSLYEGLPQGSEFEVFVVLEHNGSFFKKTGTGDSYSRIAWDGDFTNVTPQTKTIVEYK